MRTQLAMLGTLMSLLLSSASGCNHVSGNGIVGSDNHITRDFKVGYFDKIDASIVANITFVQSDSNSLQIYGSDNIVELIGVEVKDNTLYLKMKKKVSIKKGKTQITISSPDLKSIQMSGVGNLAINETLNTPSLAINNGGVGNINIKQIICTDLNIQTSGVGNVTVSGKAQNANLSSDGVGNIKAAELEAENVKAGSNGVGNISCFATTSISARVNGVGNISYKGNPKTKDLKKNGVGNIKQK